MEEKTLKKTAPWILVAEDQPEISQLMAQLIKARDQWKVEIVENGEVAIKEWNRGDYDIIIMDIQMPVKGGIEATKEIRKAEKDNKSDHRIPIIALTANSSYKRATIEAGMDDFLSKPFKVKVLIEAINKQLKKIGKEAHIV